MADFYFSLIFACALKYLETIKNCCAHGTCSLRFLRFMQSPPRCPHPHPHDIIYLPGTTSIFDEISSGRTVINILSNTPRVIQHFGYWNYLCLESTNLNFTPCHIVSTFPQGKTFNLHSVWLISDFGAVITRADADGSPKITWVYFADTMHNIEIHAKIIVAERSGYLSRARLVNLSKFTKILFIFCKHLSVYIFHTQKYRQNLQNVDYFI